MQLLIYPLIPTIILGTINVLYWRRQGYTNLSTIILSYIAFYALSYTILSKLI